MTCFEGDVILTKAGLPEIPSKSQANLICSTYNQETLESTSYSKGYGTRKHSSSSTEDLHSRTTCTSILVVPVHNYNTGIYPTWKITQLCPVYKMQNQSINLIIISQSISLINKAMEATINSPSKQH